MLRSISARELAEWQAYYRLEPFGQERDDLHAAGIIQAIYHAFAGRAKALGRYTFARHLEESEERTKPQTKQQIFDTLEMITLAMGGIVNGSNR